jgi:hypothetical protein
MENTIETYQGLITSEYAEQPNFQAVIALSVTVYVQIQSLLNTMIPIFDLSTPPVGNQLDIIGQWVGISRLIENPYSNIFFTWDGTMAQGWDFGIWQSSGNPSAIVSLPDDIYLTLILAKIAQNNWDGTTESIYQTWAMLFPGVTLLIQDYQNMSFAVAIQGIVPDSLTLALLTGGYLVPRPEGIEITEYFVPVNTGPLFAWDCDSASLQGWDTGSWAMEYAPT